MPPGNIIAGKCKAFILVHKLLTMSRAAVSLLGEGALSRCGDEIKNNKKQYSKALVVTDQAGFHHV